MLWCDGRCDSGSCHEEGPTSKKSKKAEEREKSEDKGGTSEKDFDAVVKQLQKKHGDIFSVPLLRLWARVHVNGLHDSLDDHPDLPQFKALIHISNLTQSCHPIRLLKLVVRIYNSSNKSHHCVMKVF